jgi:two-component system cell cycle sensor histidine kinase/response regulator CckA
MSAPKPQGGIPTDDSTRTAAVATALRVAADRSDDARAVYEAVRDPSGTLVDLRILYGNASFWNLSGIDPDVGPGLEVANLMPGVDWSKGLAGRIFQAMGGRAEEYSDARLRFRPQGGPYAGQERVFETELAGSLDVIAVRMRDITDDVGRATRQSAEARRSAALASFLHAAVDPAIDRQDLLAILAGQLAETIDGLSMITVQEPGGSFVIAAVAGGPGDTAARMMEAQPRSSIAFAEGYGDEFSRGATTLASEITQEVRARIGRSLKAMGLPGDLAGTVNSTIGAGVLTEGKPIGRVHIARFGADPPLTDDDRATVEAIASAAALVLERRGVEDRLAATSARFEAVFEQAPVAMVAIGRDRSVRYNDRALELFGRDREEMLRLAFQPGAPWIPPDQVERWEEMRTRIGAGEHVTGVRLALVRPSGERREIEGSSIQIVTPEGAHSGLVTVMADLTDRLSLEAQFLHAQKMEALGRLAGGIAHDFNNVLMAIAGFADLVATDAREGLSVNAAHADEIVTATRRAIELTARLTTFARREVARLESVDVGDTIRGLLPMLSGLVPESIEISTQFAPAPPVTLDRSEFEQALVNLVVNAVDAMPSGGRLVIEVIAVELDEAYVATHVGEAAGRHVQITVSDTGVGMDEATQQRIFEPFYTTKGVGEGTGLGLSMVFAAIQRANGTIWVYSEVGHGTTFKIYLPGAAASTLSPPRGSALTNEIVGGSESILLLEDDPLVRGLLETILRRSGYDVTVTARPSEALAAAEGRRFDLLVTDMVMPEMMGDAIAAKLRVAQPDLRIILMSGYTAKTVAIELGSRDSFLHKPLLPVEVARAVREALDREDPG